MRRIALVICAGFLCAPVYLGWPFHTAWSIKEAVEAGDSGYLARHVEWTPVKVTLKESMSRMVLGPQEASLEDKQQRQGLWANFKAYYGRTMVDTLVERYANPTGLPTLFSYGRTVRRDLLGTTDPDDGQPLHVRIANAWQRIDRAAFITPTRFEIEMRDKFEPTRVYAGVLELKDWRWMVTELRVRQHQPDTPTGQPIAPPQPETTDLRFSSRIATR
ncbi:MAG: DUF2939 domain-containing protein [Alphaproteobacteria bacterium]|nr:DUF2939 domain-containing protein [Alphaproteobacteria bacterium]